VEAEHRVGASKTTGNQRRENQDGQSGGEYTGDDRKAAVIGRSKCTVAQKLEQGTTPTGGTSIQGWGASAAPLPDIPLSVVDELPPPLLDCGQGKINTTTGADGGEWGRGDWIQARVLGNGEQWDEFWTGVEDMTAKKDCIPASNTSRPPNSVDLPRSDTTPKPPSVVPPSGEHVMVNADMTVNGVHPPPERSSTGARKRVAETTVNGAQPPLEHSSARARKRVRWRDPVQCSAHNAAMTRGRSATLDGIQPPSLLATGHLATGTKTNRLRLQNKRQRHALRDAQVPTSFWTKHTGTAVLPPQDTRPNNYRNEMCPAGIATAHLAGPVLAEWSKMGCPTQTGNPWTKAEMWEAVERGPHKSSLTPAAIAHFAEESAEKVRVGQAKLVLWDDIKDNPPPQLKVSLIMVRAHESKVFQSILNLSFCLRIQSGASLRRSMMPQSSWPLRARWIN
jgi:hypothetical protein